MSEKYTYLFPYEKVPHGSRIIIYGAGDVGQEYLKQMLLTGYADVVCFLDRAFDKYHSMIIPVLPPEKVVQVKFDYIVIAMKTAIFYTDISNFLQEKGVVAEQIVHIGARGECNSLYMEESKTEETDIDYAYKKAPISIALKFGPGLGDAVIKKRLFREIVKMAPEAKVDIYTPGGAKFIKSFYADEPNLNCAIDDGGALYAQHHKEYGLSMSIFFMIQVDHVDYGKIERVNTFFAERIRLHVQRHREYGLSPFPTVQNHIHFRRSMYKGKNCYTFYNYTNVFHIGDQKINIPVQDKYREDYEALGLHRYITFNYGNGAAGKENKEVISKQWPKEYFENFVILFKKKYPDIEVVQLGDDYTEPISNVDRILFGKDLEIVKYILKGALLHLDIEGGLMHLATQLGTKCAVIYGPTQVELFSYPQNINIVSDKCKNCYLLYPEYYKCARGMEKPECMWSILPENVLSEIEVYLEEKVK